MRDHLVFWINGTRHEVRDETAFTTLSRYLRLDLRATGTKVVCEEGDCGACTVLIGRPAGDHLAYRPVNSCIQFLFQLDGVHIITVEGLGPAPSPVQESMIRCHGAQCGYCTPGFVVAMTALFESNEPLTEATVKDGLTGNLCRCTGYDPIVRAAMEVDRASVQRMDDLYPPRPMLDEMARAATEEVRIETGGRTFFRPRTVESAIRFRAEHPGTVILQGGTDLAVLHNKRGIVPRAVLTLDGLDGLDELSIDNGMLVVGARVTVSELKAFAEERIPELGRVLEWFGSPQIRNTGTLAGNVANASPIADTIPFLMVMGAEVELAGPNGTRTIDINSFYRAYKTTAAEPGEMITRVLVPLPDHDETLKLYRVAKRRHLDIASFTAAIRMKRTDGSIDRVRIAYGGVAPVVLRLPKTEAFLSGKRFDLESFESAGELAREEISPISDVRGSAEFRSQLAANILKKFFYESAVPHEA